jgi:hypothetical protein
LTQDGDYAREESHWVGLREVSHAGK